MKHSCDNCGADLQISEDSPHFVPCEHCNTLHFAAEVIARLRRIKFTPPSVLLPERFTFSRLKDGVLITSKWNRMLGLALSPFALVFAVFVLLALVAAEKNGLRSLPSSIPMVLFAAIGMYAFLANMFNRREILATRHGITISDGPFPVLPKRRYTASRIQGCFASGIQIRNGGSLYATMIWFASGPPVQLFAGVDAGDEAWFLAYHLNHATGLEQRKKGHLHRHAKRRKRELLLLKREAKAGSVQAKAALGMASLFGGPVTRRLLRGRSPAPPQPKATELACRRCGAPTTEDGMYVHECYSLCSYCGTLQDISHYLKVERPPLPDLHTRHPNWVFDYSGRYLDIRPRRPWGYIAMFGIAFVAVLILLAIFVAYELMPLRTVYYCALPIALPAVLVGIGYHLFKTFALRRSYVDARHVQRWDHLLARRPNVDLARDDIVQVFASRAQFNDDDNRVVPGYEVSVIDRASRKLTLVNRLRTPQEAFAVERRIEAILAIEDVPVKRLE